MGGVEVRAILVLSPIIIDVNRVPWRWSYIAL